MDKQLKFLKLGTKIGTVILVAATLAFGGLFLAVKSTLAGDPNLTLKYLVAGPSWNTSVDTSAGKQIQFYAEIHNTNVPSTANNVRIVATLPGGTFTTGTSTATVSADNASSVSQSVTINIAGGGQLQYVPGSTHMTWDPNGDGILDFNNTPMPDGIIGSGLLLGNQNGCNQFIIQISFKANVIGQAVNPSPSPSPGASPSPSASPAAGGITNTNNNSNSNTNNNNITINNTQNQSTVVPAAAQPSQPQSAAAPKKQPETGVSVLSLVTMFGAGPLGLYLSRYGQLVSRKEEKLGELALGLFKERSAQINQV